MLLRITLSCFLLLNAFFAFSQENKIDPLEKITPSETELGEVVVVDSRFEIKRSQSGKNVIKISEKEILVFQGNSLSELLQTYGGINIIGSRSAAGQNLNFSIRGGRNRQVLILIDGVRVSDPSRIDNDFDLNYLNLSDIVSIEIVKGAASTLYGSSASTGVVYITTKKSNKALEFSVGSVVGSQQAANESFNKFSYLSNYLNLSGTRKKLIYKFNIANQNINGMSSVSNGDELDRFNRSNIGVQFGRDGASFDWNLSYNKAHIASDYDNVFPVEDADFVLITDLERFFWSSSYSYSKGSINATFGMQNTDRDFQDSYPRYLEASNLMLDVYNKYILKERLYAIVGYTHQNSSYEGVPSVSQNDVYFNLVYLSSYGFNLNAGTRLNKHEIYGDHLTYSFNPSYSFNLANENRLKLFSSLSSAFIPPSLYQLYDFYSGNLELKPEENTTFELGTEWSDNKNMKASLVVFRRIENPTLVYDFSTYRYGNSESELTYKGVEFEYQNKLFNLVDLRFNYTYNETTGGNLINLPKHAASGILDYDVHDRFHVNTSIQHIGTRASLSNHELEAYTLVDLKLTHTFLNQRLNAFLILSNLFDTEYIEIENFSTQGRNFRVGLNFTL